MKYSLYQLILIITLHTIQVIGLEDFQIVFTQDFEVDDGSFISYSSKAYHDNTNNWYTVETFDDTLEQYWAKSPSFQLIQPDRHDIIIKLDLMVKNQDLGTYPSIQFFESTADKLFFGNSPTNPSEQPIITISSQANDQSLRTRIIDDSNNQIDKDSTSGTLQSNVWYTVTLKFYDKNTKADVIYTLQDGTPYFEELNINLSLIKKFSNFGFGFYNTAGEGSQVVNLSLDNIEIKARCSGENRKFSENCDATPGYFSQGLLSSDTSLCNYPCETCSGNAANCTGCKDPTNRIQKPACQCKSGFYNIPDDPVCQQCDFPCYRCLTDANNCQSCIGDNRNIDSHACEPLPGFYEASENDAQPCANKCQTCSTSADNCVTCSESNRQKSNDCDCIQGFYDAGEIYCKKCPIECPDCTTQNNCISLEVCSPQCSTCSLNPDNCTSCNGGQNRKQTAPCECEIGYITDTTNPKDCIFSVTQQKIYCQQSCIRCNFEEKLCLECDENFDLLDGKCVCDKSKFFYKGKCVNQCEEKKYMDLETLTCFDCFFLNETCVKECPSNTIINEGTKQCELESKLAISQVMIILIVGVLLVLIALIYTCKKHKNNSKQTYNNLELPMDKSQGNNINQTSNNLLMQESRIGKQTQVTLPETQNNQVFELGDTNMEISKRFRNRKGDLGIGNPSVNSQIFDLSDKPTDKDNQDLKNEIKLLEGDLKKENDKDQLQDITGQPGPNGEFPSFFGQNAVQLVLDGSKKQIDDQKNKQDNIIIEAEDIDIPDMNTNRLDNQQQQQLNKDGNLIQDNDGVIKFDDIDNTDPKKVEAGGSNLKKDLKNKKLNEKDKKKEDDKNKKIDEKDQKLTDKNISNKDKIQNEKDLLKEGQDLKTEKNKKIDDKSKLLDDKKNKKIDDKNKKVDEKDKKVDEKDKKVDEKDKKVDEKDKKVGEKDKKIDEKDKKLDEKDKKVDEKDKKLNEKDKKVDEKDKKVDEKDKKLEGKDKKVDEKNKKVDEKDKKLDEKDKKVDEKDKKVDEKDKKLNDKNQKLDGKDKKLDDKNQLPGDKNINNQQIDKKNENKLDNKDSKDKKNITKKEKIEENKDLKTVDSQKQETVADPKKTEVKKDGDLNNKKTEIKQEEKKQDIKNSENKGEEKDTKKKKIIKKDNKDLKPTDIKKEETIANAKNTDIKKDSKDEVNDKKTGEKIIKNEKIEDVKKQDDVKNNDIKKGEEKDVKKSKIVKKENKDLKTTENKKEEITVDPKKIETKKDENNNKKTDEKIKKEEKVEKVKKQDDLQNTENKGDDDIDIKKVKRKVVKKKTTVKKEEKEELPNAFGSIPLPTMGGKKKKKKKTDSKSKEDAFNI